jgi:hypothetical protein
MAPRRRVCPCPDLLRRFAIGELQALLTPLVVSVAWAKAPLEEETLLELMVRRKVLLAGGDEAPEQLLRRGLDVAGVMLRGRRLLLGLCGERDEEEQNDGEQEPVHERPSGAITTRVIDSGSGVEGPSPISSREIVISALRRIRRLVRSLHPGSSLRGLRRAILGPKKQRRSFQRDSRKPRCQPSHLNQAQTRDNAIKGGSGSRHSVAHLAARAKAVLNSSGRPGHRRVNSSVC